MGRSREGILVEGMTRNEEKKQVELGLFRKRRIDIKVKKNKKAASHSI